MTKQHGTIDWLELQTTDIHSAQSFYGQLFGWEFAEDTTTGVPYHMVKVGDPVIGGAWQSDPSAQIPPHWGNYITVSDVNAIAHQVEQLGGKMLVPPQDIPTVGRFCTFQDPQGAVISAITYQET